MKELPTTKDEIEFDDKFIDLIKKDNKSVTIRNSPVSLGYKHIEKHGINIEVVTCEKIDIKFSEENKVFGNLKEFYVRSPMDKNFIIVGPKTLGFCSQFEMYDYYKQYLKRDFAYAIAFNVCEED